MRRVCGGALHAPFYRAIVCAAFVGAHCMRPIWPGDSLPPAPTSRRHTEIYLSRIDVDRFNQQPRLPVLLDTAIDFPANT